MKGWRRVSDVAPRRADASGLALFGPNEFARARWMCGGLETLMVVRVVVVGFLLEISFTAEGYAHKHLDCPRDALRACRGKVDAISPDLGNGVILEVDVRYLVLLGHLPKCSRRVERLGGAADKAPTLRLRRLLNYGRRHDHHLRRLPTWAGRAAHDVGDEILEAKGNLLPLEVVALLEIVLSPEREGRTRVSGAGAAPVLGSRSHEELYAAECQHNACDWTMRVEAGQQVAPAVHARAVDPAKIGRLERVIKSGRATIQALGYHNISVAKLFL